MPNEESLILICENSVVASAPHFYAKFEVYGDLIGRDDITDLIWQKYPEMAELLICIAQKESSFNQYAIGDHGKAKGLFQIHTKKHNISDDCAFSVECSLSFTAAKIKAGKGMLWSTYKKCI